MPFRRTDGVAILQPLYRRFGHATCHALQNDRLPRRYFLIFHLPHERREFYNEESKRCRLYPVAILPSMTRDALATIVPALLCAMQLYTPISIGFMLTMKKTSSVGNITCIRRSRAAGKSLPPSFCHAISGEGSPSAAQSSRAVWSTRTVIFDGFFVKVGNTGQWQYAN